MGLVRFPSDRKAARLARLGAQQLQNEWWSMQWGVERVRQQHTSQASL